MTHSTPVFLQELLNARSPSGCEHEAHTVVDRHLAGVADSYTKDALGNRFASLNPGGSPTLMLAGHIDELGLQIRHIDKNGFCYFDTIGGHDLTMISGRRVIVLTKNGPVKGVTGKRAIHLMTPEDRKKVPELHDLWIDLGAKTKEEALSLVRLGDMVVYDHGFEIIRGTVATARAFDDKAGAYTVLEALRRLAAERNGLAAKVVSVATVQEEIGTRGAIPSSYTVNPDVALAVDVGHATDHPDCDPRKHGDHKLGGGPLICRGPNINPLVFERLVECAEREKIPFQIETDARPTGTDARSIQIARGGVATGLLSIPLRYMHTPSEVVDLQDVENTVKLIVAFARSLSPGERFHW